MDKIKKEKNIILKIGLISIIANLFLFALKLTFGILGNSKAVIIGSIDSGLDVIVAIIILMVGWISRKERDKNHPYGHEKIESVVSIILGIGVIIIGIELGINAIKTIIEYSKNSLEIVAPNFYAIIAAAITLITKLILFIVTKKYAKKSYSQALVALSKDHLSDSLSNLLLLISVIISIFGVIIFEPIASIVITLFIIYNGFDLIKSSYSQVVDESVNNVTRKNIKETILSVPGVQRIDDMRTRLFGMKIYVDVEIAVSEDLTVIEAHNIAESVHREVETKFLEVKHCMVHVNPANDPKNHPNGFDN